MKKIVKGLLVILCFIFGIFIYSVYKTYEIKTINKDLEKEINKIKNSNAEVAADSKHYEEEINIIKEQQKDKVDELEIWKKAKEKLEKTLSS